MRKLSRASLAATVLLGLAIAPLVGAAAPADTRAGADTASSGSQRSTPRRPLLLADCRSDYLACEKSCGAMVIYSAGNTSQDDFKKCARACASGKRHCDIDSEQLLQSEPQPAPQIGPQPSGG